MVDSVSIKTLIDTDYRAYSMYTLENRAIPSAIDGLKPVQRKILYCATRRHAKGKKIKVADLGSISDLEYHHGEKSAQDAAVGMIAPWQNNMSLFEAYGNFGSRLVQAAAAPRYIHCKVSQTFDQYFADTVVCPVSEDGDQPEPKHYLPHIPWVLVNGIEGIAVGFAVKILPRAVSDLKSACVSVLNGDGITETITPTFPAFRGSIIQGSSPLHWVVRGIVQSKNTTTFDILELPIGYDREKYVDLLHGLVDAGKIKDFTDLCDGNGFRFSVRMTREQKKSVTNPLKFFKLEKNLHDNLTTIDAHGKLRVFASVRELIEYFVEYRLEKYKERIRWEISRSRTSLEEMVNIRTFMHSIIRGDHDLRTTSKPDMTAFIHDEITTSKTTVKKMLDIPIYKFTMDEIQNLETDIEKQNAELNRWKSTTAKSLYLDTLGSV